MACQRKATTAPPPPQGYVLVRSNIVSVYLQSSTGDTDVQLLGREGGERGTLTLSHLYQH